jgi:hypothetical protein
VTVGAEPLSVAAAEIFLQAYGGATTILTVLNS